MAEWKHTLKLKDVFHRDDMTFEQRRDEIVHRIKTSPFWDEYDDDLPNLTDELQRALDTTAFDETWSAFYYWFDENLVWVETR